MGDGYNDYGSSRYHIIREAEASLKRLKTDYIDVYFMHGYDALTPVDETLRALDDLITSGKIRYIGVTTTLPQQYAELQQLMRTEPLDFIGIDYAVDNRAAEETILPLAQERGIGVLVYLPFGRTRMWQRIGDRPLPDWAHEFDAHTWAQFMLKFVVAHPAITVATPGTSQPHHMTDNLGGGRGRLSRQLDRCAARRGRRYRPGREPGGRPGRRSG